ncbi:hypothetical protein D3C87_1511450 [compost metagenome]
MVKERTTPDLPPSPPQKARQGEPETVMGQTIGRLATGDDEPHLDQFIQLLALVRVEDPTNDAAQPGQALLTGLRHAVDDV